MQNHLITKLNRYKTWKDFPVSNLIVGKEGMGKSIFMKECLKKYSKENLTIINLLEIEDILECYDKIDECIYLIDFSESVSNIEKKQNKLLKFIEEPPINCKIFILANSKSIVLPTIINRCMVWEFTKYTKEELDRVHQVEDEWLTSILDTPKLRVDTRNTDREYFETLKNIITQLFSKGHHATYSNILSIDKYLGDGQYDFGLFLNACRYELYRLLIEDSSYINLYLFTSKVITELENVYNINKKYLIDKYLVEVKDELTRIKSTHRE